MLTVTIGLVGAFIFGSADFFGGMASKRISSVRATMIAAVTGLIVLLIALPFVGGEWSTTAVIYGGISGISGALAIVLLYACLAIGPMSILSPVTALVSAIVPMTWGLLGGERLGPLGYLALGLALVAVVLVGFVPEKSAVRPSIKALGMAVASGAFIGVFMILIDQTPDDSGLVPLIMNRAVNATVMVSTVGVIALVALRRRAAARAKGPAAVGAVALGAAGASPGEVDGPDPDGTTTPHPTRPSGGTWLPGLKFAIICGILDAVANSAMLLGLRLGDLTVMSVLTAMYPAGTIVLAAIVLKEKLTKLQIVGLVLALTAAALLSVG